MTLKDENACFQDHKDSKETPDKSRFVGVFDTRTREAGTPSTLEVVYLAWSDLWIFMGILPTRS